jgi:hypothetical protein
MAVEDGKSSGVPAALSALGVYAIRANKKAVRAKLGAKCAREGFTLFEKRTRK